MEASASQHASAKPFAVAPEQATEQRDDRRMALVFVGSVLTIYIVIGLAIYILITSLT